MVILIISVTSMMVAPSFFSSSSNALENEANRLVQTLRLAQDEAVLSSQILRVTLRKQSYSFQSLSSEGKWMPFNLSPFQTYPLIDGIHIDRIHPQAPDIEQSDEKKEPVLAHLLLMPDGINQITDITLIRLSDNKPLQIQLRPGPGGIRIKKSSSEML